MVRVVGGAALAALALLVGAQLAFGSSEQASSFNVWVGEQKKAPAGTPKQTSLNQFFPGRLTIAAGDSVTFSAVGFHNVVHLAGTRNPPDVLLPKGQVYEGIEDAAGQPFHFDGQQKFIYNAPKFSPAGPKRITRSTPTNSGLLPAMSFKKPTKVTYAFPQAGTFKLICNIHPQMGMTVTVKAAGASVPTPEEVLAQAQEETAAAWAKAKAIVATKVPKNTVYMGVDGAKASGGRTTLLDFLPDVLTVKAGTAVNFVMKSPTEFHNVGLGPKKYLDKFMKTTELFPFPPVPNVPNQVTPVFVYGTDPPGTPYDGTNHGNGFYGTALLDMVAGGGPARTRLRFTNPGKYHFICMLHGPDMAADIRVTR
jgi:plastocyanin